MLIDSMFLRDKGFEVETATNAEDAVALVRRRPFNLVLLDEQMPGKRGMEAFHELREADPNVAIVMELLAERGTYFRLHSLQFGEADAAERVGTA